MINKLVGYADKINTLFKDEIIDDDLKHEYEFSKRFLKNDIRLRVFPDDIGVKIQVKVNNTEKVIDVSDNLTITIPFPLVNVNLNVDQFKIDISMIRFSLNVFVVIGTGILSKKINLINKPLSVNKTTSVSNKEIHSVSNYSGRSTVESKDMDMIKFYSLINLIKADHKIDEQEKKFFKSAIELAFDDEKIKQTLIKELHSDRIFELDFTVFKNSQSSAINLLLLLTELAERDGEIPTAERKYILSVGNQMGFNDSDINDIIGNKEINL